MGAGFIPVPIADFLAITAIQLDMVRQLCRVYELDFKEREGKAIVSALTTSGLAKMGARAVVKIIPGLGSVIGGVTLAIFSGASTYALGEVFKRHFASGGTILDFDMSRIKKMYDEKFEKGKDIARKIRKEQEAKKETKIRVEKEIIPEETLVDDTPDDIVTQLTQLAELKASGALTEDEYEAVKKKILEDPNL
jgi:uncharacterized protein (DUF697 family)